jgi:hypothetical protein
MVWDCECVGKGLRDNMNALANRIRGYTNKTRLRGLVVAFIISSRRWTSREFR